MFKKKQVFILIILISLLILINYSLLDRALEKFFLDYEYGKVERVIDGDTIVIENKTSVRLLGINSPEKGEDYYAEAKKFLENNILNKTVNLKYGKERYDKYGRTLAYIFFNNKNINLKLIEEGFANYYFPSGKDQYYNEFKNAWENCIDKNINLCEKSENICAECVDIKDSNTIINICSFSCDITNWRIKEEGRNKFVFNKTLQPNQEADFELDLTDFGKSLFLRDDKGGLVAWESY